MTSPTNVHIHIDRLILDGISIPHAQRPLLQAAMETELTRLVTENGLSNQLQTNLAVPHLSAGAMAFSPDTSPSQMGQQIARSIYGGIGA
ncbi:MAG: hypothetical protein AAFX78_04520 [Cyanobacteria bacterium J06638_20]